jgi:hypothetical protein
MLTPVGHLIHSVGAFKIKYVDPHRALNSCRRRILSTLSGHLKLNMLSPEAHLIHTVGAFKIKYVEPCGAFNSHCWGI